MLIARAIQREISLMILGMTTVLLVVLLSNHMLHTVHKVSDGMLSLSVFTKLMVIQIPILLAFLLPLALYLAMVLVLGRWYADHEMLILVSHGMGIPQLLRMISPTVLSIFLLVSVLELQVKPMVDTHQHQLLLQQTASPLVTIPPKTLVPLFDNWVIYANSKSPQEGILNQVFLMRSFQKHFDIITATQAVYDTKQHALVCHHGYRYQGTADQKQHSTLQYDTLSFSLPHHDPQRLTSEKYQPSTLLWQHAQHNPLAQTELYWRLAMPMAVLVLSVLGISLAHLKPRQDRYARLLPALIAYIGYMQLLFGVKTWCKTSLHTLSPCAAFLMVHLLFLLLACWLMARNRGQG